MKLMSKKVLSLAVVATLTLGVLAGCGKSDTGSQSQAGGSATPAPSTQTQQPATADTIEGTVTASGSTALLPMVKAAGDQFMQKYPKVTINVSGGGSGTGVKNVADGTSDIGNSDVEAAPEFKDKGLVDNIVCIAPFALIVNKDVNVDNLTKQQAQDIYAGKITNWKDVGGQDLKITLVHRPDSSGSKKLVQNLIMGSVAFSKDGVTQDSSGAVRTAVGQTSGSIGYVDTPYLDASVKALKIDGVEFSKDNIKSGKYPLYGTEHMYTKGEAKGAAKAFLDFIKSDDFQSNQMEKLGFLPANLLKK